MQVYQLETPALIVDLDVAEENQRRMMALLRPLEVALRPHYKSHKCTALAHLQMDNGAKGITCAKLSEAEDLVLAGIPDVLIANQVVEPSKLARLAWLASCAHVSVCADTAENILALEQACAAQDSELGVLVEYDVGMNRCGVRTPDEMVALARLIGEQEHLEFMGVQAYAGQLSHEYDHEKRGREADIVEKRLHELVALLHAEGIEVPEVSGASTGTAELRGEGTIYTEVQAGTYLLMDAAYERMGVHFDHALFMVSTVLSADAGRLVCDAGLKSLGTDQGGPVFLSWPDEKPEMSEEHCAIYCENSKRPGDKVLLVPGHCCTTINLFDSLYLVRGNRVVDRVPVTSRGKCR